MYAEQVLPQEIDNIWTDDYQKHYIGIGGTCTIKTETENIDLTEATINVQTKTLTGKLVTDIELGFRPWEVEDHTYKMENIKELIFEGFYINEHNRQAVLNLANNGETKLTKIPRRD